MSWTEVLLAALAGGFVLFVWGAICWMALPHHHGDFRALPKAEEDAVAGAVGATGAKAGLYAVPHFRNYAGMNDPALAARYERGPNFSLTVFPPGPCMQAGTFVKGFALDVLAAFAAAVIWRYASPELGTLAKRVLFFAGVGALVNGFPGLSQVVWMKSPLRNALTMTVDGVVGFALLALTFHLLF